MKVTIEIDAEPHELEPLVRMIMMGQLSDADVAKAKQREITYANAERNVRVSQMVVQAHERSKQQQLAKPKSK